MPDRDQGEAIDRKANAPVASPAELTQRIRKLESRMGMAEGRLDALPAPYGKGKARA